MSVRHPSRPSPAAPSGSLRPPSSPSIRTTQRSARRVALVRAGAWTAVTAGPVALAVAVAVAASAPAVAPPTVRTAAPAVSRVADPAGVAELFCDLWLRADSKADGTATVRAVRALAPDVALPEGIGRGGGLLRTVAVRSAKLKGGAWSVVVAAQFGPASDPEAQAGAGSAVRYFAVPVTSSSAGGAGGFTVTAAPAEIAGPGPAKVPASAFETVLPGQGVLAVSLSEFFNAYLAGVGEVGRYLAPGTDLSAVRGSGYRSVQVSEVLAESDVAEGSVPSDGAVVRVRAAVIAVDAEDGRWPLAYELTLLSRSGRWEVAGLQAGAESSAPRIAVGGAAK